METTTGPSRSGERLQLALSRTASRSSTNSSQTRTTSLSGNSARSHAPASPQQLSAHSSSRPRHRAWSRSSVDPPKSQLSREVSDDPGQPLTPVSALLQERLQKERKVESERSLSRMSSGRMSAPLDGGKGSQGSPTRGTSSDNRRPQSSGGPESTGKKGLGLKEMEQTLSTLHKQNFDLKLEVFHRRERETALEQRVETLESKQNEMQGMNDKLIEELEKRDKAVEEAVAMIVVLEARVEQLLREREMVRQVDADAYLPSSANQSTPLANVSTPKMGTLEPSRGDARSLNRMPSFLSEHHESTENLRNVYLGVRGSLVSLPRASMDGLDGDRVDNHDIRSPSLSVLSESSFVSVYGKKDGPTSSPAQDDGTALECSPDSTLLPRSASNPRPRIITPSKTLRRTSSRVTAASGSPRIQNINGVLDAGGSPLLRLAKLENTLTTLEDEDAWRSSPRGWNGDVASSSDRSSVRLGSQPDGRQEKREALHKVSTNMPLSREATHSNGLPPTPDTVSTSILRRYKNSNDTLPRDSDPNLANERSYLALSETSASLQSSLGTKTPVASFDQGLASQPVSATAFSSRKGFPSADAHSGQGFHPGQIPRPHSAGESIASRQHRYRESHWDSDSEDDFDGVESRASSLDYWMRESLKPNRENPPNPLSSASQSGSRRDTRLSPDLFSFPSGANGWATDAIFGSLTGQGYNGANSSGAPTPTTLSEALGTLGGGGVVPPSLFGPELENPVLDGTGTPPPPPNRRSSLHARTGSSHPGTPIRPAPAIGKLRKSPERGNRSRSNSVDWRPSSRGRSLMGFSQPRAPTAPPESQQQKQRHYPPTASQPARSRGFSSLFRRSIGSTTDSSSAPAPSSAPPTESSFKDAPAPMVGVPSWGKRADLDDDDRDSATPPPIMRKRVPGMGNFDGGAALDSSTGGGAPVGVIPEPLARPSRLSQTHHVSDEQTSPATSTGGAENGDATSRGARSTTPGTPERASGNATKNDAVSGKRKWLSIGRSNLRNRAA